MWNRLITLALAVLLLASCSDSVQNTNLPYEEIKKIMIDSLQTEDGKKALRQLLEDPNFRELIVLEHAEVNNAIHQTLLSEEAGEFWKKTLEDPKFKETLAKSMKEQQTEIMKTLIKDASYQEDLIAFFGQPDMQKELETILKSATLRKQMEEVVKQTIEDPLLQTKWLDLIKKSEKVSAEGGGSEEEKKAEDKGEKGSDSEGG